MTLPAITLSVTADPVEIWDMYWNGTWVLNALTNDNLDFGSEWDFSPTSKNLSPSKVRFFPVSGGHDHSLLGRPLNRYAVGKRNLDINGLHTLWLDYWNDLGDDTATKYVILTGVCRLDANVHPATGTNYQSLFVLRWVYLNHDISGADPNSQGSNFSRFDAVRSSDYDGDYWDLISSSLKILAVFAHPQGVVDDEITHGCCWIANTSPTATEWKVATAGYTYNVSDDPLFDVVIFARYSGSE